MQWQLVLQCGINKELKVKTMQEINLLQNQLKDDSFKLDNQTNLILTILSVILVLGVLAFGVLFFLDKNTQKTIKETIAQNSDLEERLDKIQSTLVDAKAFQAQTANIKSLLDSHSYWSPVFQELADMTFTQTQYTSIVSDSNGRIHIQGITLDYTRLGKVLLALSTSENFSKVDLLSTSPSTGQQGGITYSIDVEVKPELFER